MKKKTTKKHGITSWRKKKGLHEEKWNENKKGKEENG